MSEALEAEQKTNPQGDPITSVAAPKAEARKIRTRKRRGRGSSRPEYLFLEAPGQKNLLPAARQRKKPSVARTSTWPSPIRSLRRAKPCSWSVCCTVKAM